MKFKVGDKVKVVDGMFKGNTGVIDLVDEKDLKMPYHVICFSASGQTWVKEENLELVIDDMESSMKTFTYGSTDITILNNLKYGDCFQILEGDYKGQYGMLCTFPDEYGLDSKDSIPIVIFSEFESYPMIKSVSWTRKVKKVACEVSFKEWE